jgi:pimeloyl-ACP methyl ester carboxylesterase
MPDRAALQKMRLERGIDLAFRAAGDPARTALVLLHGVPSSSRIFHQVIGPLSRFAYVVAPDLPGSGASDVLDEPSFSAFADCVEELLERLGVRQRFLYIHDFGSAVAFRLALRAPDLVSGLIVQNGNAFRSGLGPGWGPTMESWSAPNAENEAAVTAHLTLEGTRNTYVGGLPEELTARIDPEHWLDDWRVMNLPGRMKTQRALIADYAGHVARFDEIAAYLKERQPPTLVLWGRHDPFFELAEVSAWLDALPRLEAHVFDGGHFLLETHADQATRLMSEFLEAGSS